MEVGAPVWVRDKDGDEAWVAGTVLEKSSSSPCKVQIEVDEEFSEEPLTFTFSADDGYELEDLKLANDEEMDYVEDLISLPHLHEAAILHSLCKRFDKGEIYTFTANAILLAVNPFKRLPCYSQDILMEYFNNGFMKQQGIEPAKPLGPHVFAIADSAYRDMMKGIHAGKAAGMGPGNQSILISGESGAGKTESTKFVMRYLTTVGNGGEGVELEKGSIMDRVLQSNPILEAFGNARTIRNDNSSRFGKFIELMFDKRGSLLGAGIETYLLEKVRLPTQSENERNFHIFYQMCKGGDDDERDRWELQGPEEYHFVNQGECYDLRRVEDEDEFEKTKTALSTMGFEESSVETIFDIVAGLIHMGELEFEAHDEDESAMLSEEEENLECVERVCRLCCLPKDGLVRALTSKTIEVGPRREKTTIKLKDHQAYDARDALAKAFYGQLFNWLVATVNTHIKCDKKDVKASVGVLDIFGFECFEHNSFEQLCINYTNETLQQQFNQFVFKMEQKEYSKEGIEWSFVEFPDNQDCLDLIEGKQKGLLTMLDDECRMGIRGTDANYASRLYKEHTETPRFEADSAMMTKLCFAVNHYAGQVEYHVDTFCDKNKDELPKESDELFASSPNPFVVHLFNPDKGKKAKAKGKKPTAQKKDTSQAGIAGLKPTVGTQFREQLVNLMEMIRQTRPHYIRCIKPNDNAEPDEVSRVRVMEQLRYGGVLEAVRVARSGYPVRLPHKDFYARYRCLVALDPKIKKSKYPIHVGNKGAATAQKMCKELVKNVLVPAMVSKKNISEDTMQFGKSKVFLRKNAHDFLEMLRSHRITEAAVTMQRMARGFVYRSVFSTTRNAIVFIQRMGRGMMARKRVEHMRRMRAALRIQTAFRRHSARRKYLMLKSAALALQCATRRSIAVAIHRELKRQHRATKLQSWQRMLGPWKAYRKLKSASIALQCRLRQKIAYAELRELRMKAKDVGNLKDENIKLKAQILEMREKAAGAAVAAGNEQLSTAFQEAADLRSEVEKLTARVGQLEGQVADEQAARAKAEKAAAAAEAKAAGAAKAAGDAAAAGDSESKSLRAKVAELEAALEEEKRTSAAALVKADAAEAEAAAASATVIAAAAAVAVAPAAPTPARAASVEITNDNGSEVESMRAAIAELESALAGEKEKVSAAEAAAAVAVAAAAAATEGSGAARSSVELVSDNGTTSAAEADGLLRVRVAELEAALKNKDEELAAAVAVAAATATEGSAARSFVEPVPDNGTTAAAEADGLLRVRVAELEAALEKKDEELAAAKGAAAIAAADADDAGAALEGVPKEGDGAGHQLLRKRVSELEALLVAENKLASEANFAANVAKARADAAEAAKREAEAVAVATEAKAAATGGGGSGTRSYSGGHEGGGQALRERVASLEKALMEAKASAKIEVEAARASAARSAAESMSRPMDSGEDGDVESMREVLMELEAQLSRERQERERAVEERKMSEELVTHLSKQLKSRAYAAAAEAAEDGVLGAEGVLENGIANERDDEFDDGDSEEETMIGSLSRVLDEEREARRNAEEENARLQNVADAAADSERAHAKVVQSLTLELEEARKAKKKAEQSAAIATASAAALVASSDTSRPRTTPENKPRTPTPGWRSAIHGALEAGIASRAESFGANGYPNAGGSSHPSSPGSNVSGLTNPSTKPSQLHTNAVLEFEERLEAIRTGLSQGVDCHVWEEKTRRAEAIMSATEGDSGSSKLTFAAKGTYLIWRAPVRPIPLDSNLKVSLGHGDLHGLSNEDDSTFLNVTVGSQGQQEEGRTIIIQVADKEMRNDLVSSLRRLLTQAKVGAMAAKMRGPRSRRPGSGSGGSAGSGSGSGTGERPGVSRRVSVFDLGGGSRLPPSLSSPPTRGPRGTLSSSMSFQLPSSSGGFGGGGGGTPNGDRSPSKGTAVALGSHRKIDRSGGEDPEMVDLLRNQLEQLAMTKESELNSKEVELQEARLSSERTMVQMMELTNEVNTKQDEIRMLKRQAAEAVEDMEEMRRTHKDNANVSMQLLKKMEGLQFDNEELRHETEVLRNQVAVFYNEARLAREGRDGPHENPPSRPISLSSREDGMPASPSESLSSFTSGFSHAGGNEG